MAEANNTDPSNNELGQIARIIKIENMSRIATECLELKKKQFTDIERNSKAKDSEWKVNYKTLKIWRKNTKDASTEVCVNVWLFCHQARSVRSTFWQFELTNN